MIWSVALVYIVFLVTCSVMRMCTEWKRFKCASSIIDKAIELNNTYCLSDRVLITTTFVTYVTLVHNSLDRKHF